METFTPEVEKGRLNEKRFFRVAQENAIAPWFCGVLPVTEQQDACGVDAVALIKRRISDEYVFVPIQIKSSFCGVTEHLIKYPDHWIQRVVFVVVNDDFSDEYVCHQLKRGLTHAHQHSYDYLELFYEIDQTHVSPDFIRFLKERALGRKMSFT